jgi:hypothetical protein
VAPIARVLHHAQRWKVALDLLHVLERDFPALLELAGDKTVRVINGIANADAYDPADTKPCTR